MSTTRGVAKGARYELFIDESGCFLEGLPHRRGQGAARDPVPSQIVGVLAEAGALTGERAEAVLRNAFSSLGKELPAEVHANEIRSGQRFDQLVTSVANGVRDQGWRAVRLLNRARVGFGDRAATYTNMVAELVLRIFQTLERSHGDESIQLRLIAASVLLGVEGRDERPIFLEPEEYRQRLDEHLVLAQVRRGVPANAPRWLVEGPIMGSGRRDRDLQLCDVLSNASHSGFRRLGQDAEGAVREAFGPFDFVVFSPEAIERARNLADEGSHALGLRALAERLTQKDRGGAARGDALATTHHIVERLSALPAPARDVQLQVLLSWAEQLIEQQRQPELGRRACEWLREHVAEPLDQTQHGAGDAAWFHFALHRLALTAANHEGALESARTHADALDELLPRLAGQWEHVRVLMEGLIAQAVHRTDCFEFDLASARMEMVARYYADLSELFHVSLPEVFPERVRSELRGKALGTWLQSEIYAGLSDPSRLDVARDLSDRAIDEFPALDDRRRQFQYRCQLETAAGCFEDAHSFLARSLGLDRDDHATLAAAIRRKEGFAQGFALLHWLRLGAAEALASEGAPARELLAALRETKLPSSGWFRERSEYPAHGILRAAAVVFAAGDRMPDARGALNRLEEITPPASNDQILAAIRLAALLQVAGLLWTTGQDAARRLLDDDRRGRPGFLQLASAFCTQTAAPSRRLVQLVETWTTSVRDILQGVQPSSQVRDRLTRMGRVVGY